MNKTKKKSVIAVQRQYRLSNGKTAYYIVKDDGRYYRVASTKGSKFKVWLFRSMNLMFYSKFDQTANKLGRVIQFTENSLR